MKDRQLLFVPTLVNGILLLYKETLVQESYHCNFDTYRDF